MRIKSLLLTGALLIQGTAFADWQLNEAQSSLHFLSTKNSKITETHELKAMSGNIDKQGNANISLDLSSVETGIDIRNQRMLEHLFEVSSFATADVSVKVPTKLLSLKVGQQVIESLEFNIKLHGVSKTMPVVVTITGLEHGGLAVQSVNPVVLNSQDFGLDKGIEVLRTLANLKTIVTSVPVSFALVFSPQ